MFLKINVFVFIFASHFLISNAIQNVECSKYKSLWFSYQYPYTDGLSKLSSPKAFSRVCSTSKCCDGTMQNEMVAVSKLRLQSIAEKYFQTMSELLLNTSTITIDYLLANIDSSKQQLNKMFSSTYDSNYKMHQSFFYDFYDKLKQYTDGKLDNLQTILDNFFADMAERIVGMMILAKKDPDTVRCLTNNLMKLDPYQGADKAVAALVINSYPMARMFVNSLKAANDVFINLIKDKSAPSWECAMAFSKSFYCPLCSGSKAKPCEALCRSTIGQCLGSLNSKEITRLSKAWIKVVVALDNLSKKLIHPFNLPEVNKNLHVKISDAIMNVHNFFPNVREKIWTNCKSLTNRKRRSSDDWPNGRQQNVADGQSSLPIDNVDLVKLVKTFSGKLPDMKIHLKKFKNIVCSDKKSSIVDDSDQCWTGAASAKAGASGQSKPKKNNRNLKIDPVIMKSINKFNEIASLLNSLVDGKNKDPRAFKIEFIPEPKKPASRQGDDIIPTIEGSGDSDNSTPQKPIKPVETALPNEEVVEGSGGIKNVPTKNDTKRQPSFPQLPVTEQPIVTIKPELPIKKPAITDDEDINENIDDNTKKETPGGQIEGSGQMENKPRMPLLPMKKTTTSAPFIVSTEEVVRPKIPPFEGSGGAESPDDETDKKPVIDNRPRFPDVPMPSTSTASTVLPQATVAPFVAQELPGDIPQEIWIPRVMDYDSYGRLVSVTTKGVVVGRAVRLVVAVMLLVAGWVLG